MPITPTKSSKSRQSNKNILLDAEMAKSIMGMLQSNDSKDRDMAWKIISKRDTL